MSRTVSLLLLWFALPSRAEEGTKLHFVVLPSRDRPAALRERALPIARAVAERLARTLVQPSSDLRLDVAAARAASGGLDDRARALDRLEERGAAAVDHLGDPSELVNVLVARAAIALARGEAARAAETLERVLRYDPTFALLSSEDSPRMREALAAARNRLGPRPPLRREDLSGVCGAANDLLVARWAAGHGVEFLRLTDCRLMAAVIQSDGAPDDAVAKLTSSIRPLVPNDEALAKAHFETAQGLYHQGRFADAIGEFEAGYRLVPRPEFLINLGQAYRGAGDASHAREYFARFLVEAPPDHPARDDVQQMVVELDRQMAQRTPKTDAVHVEHPLLVASPPLPPKRSTRRARVWTIVVVAATAVVAGVAVGVALLLSQPPSATLGAHTIPN